MTKSKSKSLKNIATTKDLPFRHEVRASGAGETWCHIDDNNKKFEQFGWRCTNDENAYSEDVLIGNWNEKQFDLERRLNIAKPPSNYQHYYDTTYNKAYLNKTAIELEAEKIALLKEIQENKSKTFHSFPAHQPELDTVREDMVTSSQIAYNNNKE